MIFKNTDNLVLASPIDWAQPPVGCLEELVPSFSPPECLDLTAVTDPLKDLPANLSDSDRVFWTSSHQKDLTVCRAKEVLRRESLKPKTFGAWTVEMSWMRVDASQNLGEKIDQIYDAAASVGMPAQVLFGALSQESFLANLGINPDGGNYSCGIGQINIEEWCGAARAMPSEDQAAIEWPAGIQCDSTALPTTIIAPFYQQAMKKFGAKPDYLLTANEFSNIQLKDVVSSFPNGSDALQNLRFQAAMSFVGHCTEQAWNVKAKAHELRRLFDQVIPAEMKTTGIYADGEKYLRSCRKDYTSKYYPLETGWLMADAVYNAGAKIIPVVSYYFGMTKDTLSIWSTMTPLDLIEGLHWGGKYNPVTDKLNYQDLNGNAMSVGWYKMCVVQRHIANVIRYVTLPGFEIAHSLEVGGCKQSITDPATGAVITPGIPDYRRASSGVK